MNLLDPSLLETLATMRLLARHPVRSAFRGERRSSAVGAGLEFADHRPYQAGDDIRYLDRHAFARLGRLHVRLFHTEERLPITLLLDTTASMDYGEPSKFLTARALVAALGAVGLVGGDLLDVGALADENVKWLPRLSGRGRMAILFDWLNGLRPGGQARSGELFRDAADRVQGDGLIIAVSDWMMEDVALALSTLKAGGQEVVGIQILAPEELEPERLGVGPFRLVDAESGQEIDLSLDSALHDRYRTEVDRWRWEVEGEFGRHHVPFFVARSDEPLKQFLFGSLRRGGLIG